ncbi:hypothetical protein L861_02555 [Litchfieldella anticariensis FP35 = DSM 16096]|uniref:Uncharacterized protein n=1 Tax=Litchfieldella anticariensis (strain DSM 16096 / CECT 5854 / CIP 108499 / LMG 22089 / FP35) TaxID=1121939 RepID=S2L8P4_LITA3|nr:hypothetical protein L861_02555 [Halomonas anticariensis FP35 = DSM 16096]
MIRILLTYFNNSFQPLLVINNIIINSDYQIILIYFKYDWQ